MTKKEAKKWLKLYKNAKFKCIVPDQVIEAMVVLGMIDKDKAAQANLVKVPA